MIKKILLVNIVFVIVSTIVFAACDESGLESCISFVKDELKKVASGCTILEPYFSKSIEDLYLGKGCRIKGTAWTEIQTGQNVKGSLLNGINTDTAGCIARYTPPGYLTKGGYFRTPKEALNGQLRNKVLTGCEYDSNLGKTDAAILTAPIIIKIESCECAKMLKVISAIPKPVVMSVPETKSQQPSPIETISKETLKSEETDDSPQTTTEKPTWTNIAKKCNDLKNLNPTLNEQEFITYLEHVESENKDMTRNQILAKLHQKAYEIDVDATYFFVKLFKHGSETDGYDKVTLACKNEPKYVIDSAGRKIDIAHAYAGIRSDMNRKFAPTRWFMRNVNTHWGDTFQQWIHWDSNNKYDPPDQRLGNDAGINLVNYFSKDDNKNKKLSEAFQDYFKEIDGK